jgi:hypothetical protein
MTRLARLVFGSSDLLSATLVATGVFLGLPDRWWPVDVAAAAIIALRAASGAALLAGTSWAVGLARVSAAAALAAGLALLAAVATSASYLSGIYGPVGRGGAVLFILVAALALPYLVVLPSVELVWLGRDP